MIEIPLARYQMMEVSRPLSKVLTPRLRVKNIQHQNAAVICLVDMIVNVDGFAGRKIVAVRQRPRGWGAEMHVVWFWSTESQTMIWRAIRPVALAH